MHSHDTNEVRTEDPSSEEDIFHESVEQENDALLSHAKQRNPLNS